MELTLVLSDIILAAVASAGMLLPLIMPVVTLLGKFGVHGRAQLGASLGIGFVFGIAAQLLLVGAPQSGADYFALFLAGLLPGLCASGVYEVGVNVATKAAVKSYNSGYDEGYEVAQPIN